MTATRRLAAILAADVAGYSRLIGADEEGTLNRLKSIRGELIDPKISKHRGRIVKTTGDGLLVEFSSVVDALRCATEWQTGITERNASAPEDNRIEFRIGVHQGDIVVEDDDIFGDGANVAARLEGLAEPGGICVSGRVQEDAAGRLDLAFDDLGDQSLKNITRPVRVYRVRLATTESTPKSLPVEAASVLALPDKPSIAVLPFQNMSGDPEQEYFADGITEDITTALSKVRWFFVIARNSSFAYKSRLVDVKQVGREFGVRYVLQGSVRKAGDRIRISAQLVEAENGKHVWVDRYDRDLADIFAVQDEITERVVGAIEPELYSAEHYRSQRKPPESLDAWECVIRALSCVGQVTRAKITEAEALCRRAIAIAPDYAQAHSLLAWVLVRRTLRSGEVRAILPEALAEARAASHFAYGIVLWRMRRHGEAERAFRRTLEWNPNFALAHAQLALPLAVRGAHEEAENSAAGALRLSPSDALVDAFASHAMALAHFAAGHYPDAVAWARETIERHPEHQPAHFWLIAAAAMEGDTEASAEALATLLRLRPDLSLTSVSENMPFAGDTLDRLIEGLRRAGMPEK